MRKLILASVAAFALTGGFANAQGIILGSDENDRKQWINTWAGQSEDEVYDRRYGGRGGSSASTFSGRGSTQSDRSGNSITLGTGENARKYFFVESENRS